MVYIVDGRIKMKNKKKTNKISNILYKNIWTIILASVICLASSFAFARYILPLKYTSSISLYLNISTDSSLDISSIEKEQIANTSISILKENYIYTSILDELCKSYSNEELVEYLSFSILNKKITVLPEILKNYISVNADKSSKLIRISATTKDPRLSTDLCNLMSEISSTKISESELKVSINAIGKATIPLNPSSPNILLISIFGFIGGFFISIILILIFNNKNKKINAKTDIKETFHIPLLAKIINLEESKTNNATAEIYPLITNKNTAYTVYESYQSLRLNLIFSLTARTNNKVVAISSPSSFESKSLVAANIALTLAAAKSKVLLIDADMYNPTINKIFKLKNRVGLSMLISKLTTFEKALNESLVPFLDVLTSGPLPPNPSDLLSSENMEKMLEHLLERYDYIIIDTPSLDETNDTLAMSDLIAGIILVLNSGKTTYKEVYSSIDKISRSSSYLLGTIIHK